MIMQSAQEKNKETRTLRDFTRLLIAFYGALVVLAIYQQLRLYISGVLDLVLGKSFFLLILHHLGFAALIALPLAFFFKALERKKDSLGFRITKWALIFLLLAEGLLIEYYVRNYEILGEGFISIYGANTSIGSFFFQLSILTSICLGSFYLFYRITSSTYKIIGRMYPFTIILFSLFLATLYSEKKPINENKTQHLIVHATSHALDLNKYNGSKEYPMLVDYSPDKSLLPYIDLGDQPPNLVFIILEGVGSDFIGDSALYKGFMPKLNALTRESLYWPHHLSNTGEGHASLATILGSLPFGEAGFNKAPNRINRNTVLGILKKNGYFSSFNFGGNSALYQWDKFLFEDRIDNFLDVKGFGPEYELQAEDAAGVTLGYPDGELYRKYFEDASGMDMPFIDVFFTLSTRKPFNIPDKTYYEDEVQRILKKGIENQKVRKIIKKNSEAFASLLYADRKLADFLDAFKDHPAYSNTIFVITGSHNLTELPPQDAISKYRVPLLIHSPLLKGPEKFTDLVSHADIVPSILGLLRGQYSLNIPSKVSFLGTGLRNSSSSNKNKIIPLFRHSYNIRDFVSGPYFYSDGNLQKINRDFILTDTDDSELARVKEEFQQFKAVNKYVVNENKLIPANLTLFAQLAHDPTKEEMIWINSVFNGSDFDNAYKTARKLALDGDYDRALMLAAYILNKVPGHADTEILMGRIHAWRGNYKIATEILEGAVLKYPVYTDAYSALLDVYFWSGKNERALLLQRQIDRNNIENDELKNKMERAIQSILEKEEKSTTSKIGTEEDHLKNLALSMSQ